MIKYCRHCGLHFVVSRIRENHSSVFHSLFLTGFIGFSGLCFIERIYTKIQMGRLLHWYGLRMYIPGECMSVDVSPLKYSDFDSQYVYLFFSLTTWIAVYMAYTGHTFILNNSFVICHHMAKFYGSLIFVIEWDRFVEIPEHTKTPEHTGNYRNTLKKVSIWLNK